MDWHGPASGRQNRTMSAIEPIDSADGTAREELPEFELSYLYDDEENPTEVTVFGGDEKEVLTNWITIDESHAVPLDEVR